MATTYWKGDKAAYTGRTEQVAGKLFYEVEMLEGHLAGQKKLVANGPKESK